MKLVGQAGHMFTVLPKLSRMSKTESFHSGRASLNPGGHVSSVQLHSCSNQAESCTQATVINERAAADGGHLNLRWLVQRCVPEASIYLQMVTPQPAGSTRNTSQPD